MTKIKNIFLTIISILIIGIFVAIKKRATDLEKIISFRKNLKKELLQIDGIKRKKPGEYFLENNFFSVRSKIDNEEIYLHFIDKICKESSVGNNKFIIPCEEEFLLEFYSLKEINFFYNGEKQELPLKEALEDIKFTVSRMR